MFNENMQKVEDIFLKLSELRSKKLPSLKEKVNRLKKMRIRKKASIELLKKHEAILKLVSEKEKQLKEIEAEYENHLNKLLNSEELNLSDL